MAEPFMGEIRLFAFNRIPEGWYKCEGQTLQIATNQALFSLLGIQFGGDGMTTFCLPDMRGRTPVGLTSGNQGTAGGAQTVTLTATEVPSHSHPVNVSAAAGTTPVPTNDVLATNAKSPAADPFNIYAPFDASKAVPLAPATVQNAGGGTGHENCQPSLTLVYCIATAGVYPPRP